MSEKRRGPKAFSVPGDDQPANRTGTQTETPRRPRAVSESAKITFAAQDHFDAEARAASAQPDPLPEPRKRGLVSTLVFSALGILVSLAVGLWIDGLVRELFARETWLGYVALAAAGVLALALVVFLIREIAALLRIRSINVMRQEAQEALEQGDPTGLRKAAKALEAHYSGHPMTARGRAVLAAQHGEILDPPDRYALTEHELLSGLDAHARDMVMDAAKRVSVVTAVSPRAIVDISYVLYENVRLIRTMSEHYGGRTGTFGTVRLIRNVISHLAVTGTIAIGDSLIQQLVGHGLAARLSARLGEGVVNGLMTVRVGLAAMDVCRPAPWHALPQPAVSEFINVLTRFSAPEQHADDPAEAKR